MNNIFEKSERIIERNALGSTSVSKAAYASFDFSNNTGRLLTMGEKKLCEEFYRIIEDFQLGTHEILEFTSAIDYELLFIKKACYVALQESSLEYMYEFGTQIERYKFPGEFITRVDFFLDMKNTKVLFDIDGLDGLDYLKVNQDKEYDIRTCLKKEQSMTMSEFSFDCNGKNIAEMYSFMSQISIESSNNTGGEGVDVSQVLFSYKLKDSTEVNTRIIECMKSLHIHKNVIDKIEQGKIQNLLLEIFLMGEKLEDNFEDEPDDVLEFSWEYDKLPLLESLENYLLSEKVRKIIIWENLED